MYSEFADLWPRLSPAAGYRKEGARWSRLLREALGPGQHRLLDLGSGGGHLLSHVGPGFAATAVDLSPDMLEHCRRLNPEVRTVAGDMRTVRLGEPFDAVMIHDALGYLLELDDLRGTLATAAAHLREDGLLLLGPDYVKQTFPGSTLHHYSCGEGVDVVEWCHD
ncbi:MAG: class I SAM-dependent methyltransferase, partial [Candidatus Eremiobacterota bacterium]